MTELEQLIADAGDDMDVQMFAKSVDPDDYAIEVSLGWLRAVCQQHTRLLAAVKAAHGLEAANYHDCSPGYVLGRVLDAMNRAVDDESRRLRGER